MVNYNLTNLTNADQVSDVFIVANEFSGGILTTVFMFGFFFVILMVLLRRTDFVGALATSGFVCFIISMFLSYAGLLNLLVVLLFLAICGFSVLFLYLRQN